MIQAVFSTYKGWKKAKYQAENNGWRTYEASLDPLLKTCHVCDIDPVGWVKLEHPEPSRDIARTSVQEYRVQHYTDITKSDIQDTPKLVLASWDIECVSDSGHFPDGSLMSDTIITIGTSYMVYGESEPFRRTIHQLGTCHPIDGADVFTYERESDLINAWILETQSMGVDVLLGYNTWGFDSKYIDDRASTLIDLETGDSAIRLDQFGKAAQGGGEVVQKMLNSSAYGSNNYFYHSTPGVIQLDLLMIFRKELKLSSYTLDNVSKQYLGNMSKIDLKPWEIFECFKDEAPEGRTRIAEYCARDCDLPLLLLNKLNVLTNQLEMAKVVCVPIEYLNTRGQQIRCYSQIARMTRTRGYAIQDVDKESAKDTAGYVGATVLEPEKGAYMNDIVSGLDFASLYPSIMRAHTMCPSTIVLDDAWNGIDGVEYYTVETTPGRFVWFAQDPDAVVPTLLADLATWRKKSKRDMANAKANGDTFAASLHNAKQMAYKVSMNSIYGFFGATVGMIPLLDLASAVTATGRNMILHTKKMCEDLGHKVVYGDSVAAYTPIYIKNGVQSITTFEELSTQITWTLRDDGKEYGKIDGLETWSDHGWTPVDAIIRHGHTDDLVRVATHTGVVDVTAHHSLLRPDGEMVKPCDVSIGDDLMHAPVPQIETMYMQEMYSHIYDEDGRQRDTVCIEQRDQGASARAYQCLRSYGYHVTISMDNDVYRLSGSKTIPHSSSVTSVVNISCVPYSGYVYDFSTRNHHFSAGVGDMVVHNTDSVMTILNCGEEHRLNRALHMEKAKELANTITKTFKAPNELEYEKIYSPFLLYSKKRYAALMYEDDPETPSYIDVKGLQLVRRDNAPIVRDISKGVLDILMYQRSFDLAMAFAKEQIMTVLRGETPWDKFIVSKALRTGYKNPDALPHVVVAEKRKQRGNPPANGERVPYVFIIDQLKSDLLQSQRAEDPEYAKEHQLQLDVLYYIRNQIVSPITALLQLEYKDAGKVLLQDDEIQRVILSLQAAEIKNIKEAKRVRFVKEKNLREITDFFKKK